MKKICCDGHNYTCGKNGWCCCVNCPRLKWPPKPKLKTGDKVGKFTEIKDLPDLFSGYLW